VPRPKGLPKTGGRQKGVANKRTREIADRAASKGLTPLEYMLSVLRDSSVEPERRDRMAVAAAPYIHARLAAVEAKVATIGQVEVTMTQQQLAERARREIDEAFREWPREPEVEVAAEKAREIARRNTAAQDGDRGDPLVKPAEEAEEGRPGPVSREFAREGSLESAPEVSRLPVRYRSPRPVGNWSG
jgi:hypothetical protein